MPHDRHTAKPIQAPGTYRPTPPADSQMTEPLTARCGLSAPRSAPGSPPGVIPSLRNLAFTILRLNREQHHCCLRHNAHPAGRCKRSRIADDFAEALVTPGVARELDLLRKAHAQQRTLVVTGGEAPSASWSAPIGRALARMRVGRHEPGTAPTAEPPPADFPNVLTLDHFVEPDDAANSRVDSLIAIAADQRRGPVNAPIRFPPAFRPDQASLSQAHTLALQEYDRAATLAGGNDLIAAEDALMRSIAYSHWARDPLARLSAYMLLGHVERRLRYPNEAVQAWLMALDRAEALAPTSQPAAQARPVVAERLSAYLEELDAFPRAAAIRARATAWDKSESNRQ